MKDIMQVVRSFDGVCPTCGHRIYVPMSEEKKGKIRFIVTCVAMAIFVVIFVLTQIFK